MNKKEQEREILNNQSKEKLVDMIMEYRTIMGHMTQVNQHHCDLLALYIRDYCKDKFNAHYSN
jgi:hypothetical protein